jgi:hypothetical protein
MKTLKYILILAVLTCSVTAYGSSKNSFSISISFQPARQPIYVYRPVPVYQLYQPSVVYYTCPQPVYVTPASVYRQPEVGLSFSWGNGGRSFNDGHNNYRGGHNYHSGGGGGRSHR